MKKEIFKEISRKCVEALNEYFDTCENEIEDRDNLNDEIMKIGAYYGISLFDMVWINNHSEAKKNSPELIFDISLSLTSTEAAYDDSNEIHISIWKNGKRVGTLTIDEVEVILDVNHDKNGIALIHEEDVLKTVF